MGPANISILPATLLVTGVVKPHRFVSVGLTQAGDGDNTYGVAAAHGEDEPITVDMAGVITVESGAAVTANGLVQSDATGRAINKAAGATVARALDSATAAGEMIRCVLIAN